MAQITGAHIAGALATIFLFIILGVYSGKKVKNPDDFDTGGGNAGAIMMSGMLLSAYIGGSSTIGTAQIAFTNGLSGWWFTLGVCISSIVMAVKFAIPIRESGCRTIQQIIANEFGVDAEIITGVLASLGLVLNCIVQILAANTLIGTLFGFSTPVCSAIAVTIMGFYIVFGGMKSAGILGLTKLVLMYATVIVSGVTVISLFGGFGALFSALPKEQYFNLFSRGVGVDLGACLSVVLGVLSTQTYTQTLLSGRSHKETRRGLFISAAMMPPIGLGSILVGMYMVKAFPDMIAGQAFPQFILENLNPLFGGVAIATLLFAVVGGGSSMALGFSAIATNDIYKRFINKNATGKQTLFFSRAVIVVTLVISGAVAGMGLISSIFVWSIVSMGLRAIVSLIPMCSALFFKGKVDRRFAIASSIIGFIVMMIGNLMALPFDPLFLGLFASILIAFAGALKKKSEA